MAEIGLYVLASLIGTGYLLSQNNQERPTEHPNGRITTGNDNTVGENIYNSRDYLKITGEEARRLNRNWRESEKPMENYIVPMYYNTLHVKQDAEKVPNSNYNTKLFSKLLNKLDAGTLQLLNGNNNLSSADWGIVMDGAPKRISELEMQDPLGQIGGSLTGGQDVKPHNNMVPFYGSTITQDVRPDSRYKDGKLELFTGQMKLNQQQKKETGKFFDPVKGLTNVWGWNGQGATRDVSRFNPNNTGRKQGERPDGTWQNVGPGLNAGTFTHKPSGGFHDTVRIMPKNITELRVDPVLEQEGRINHGAHQVGRSTLKSQMYRNRPELLVENKNGERNFTTVGAVTGRKLRPKLVIKETNRTVSKEVLGHAKTQHADGRRVDSKVKKSSRQNYKHTSHRNLYGGGRKVNDYGKNGYKARANNRMTTGLKMQWIAPTNAEGADCPTKRFYDKAKKTRKQHYEHNTNTYRNVQDGPNKGVAYDPNEWVMRTTIRETTEDNNHIGNINSGLVQAGDGYMSTNVEAKNTQKQFTSDNEWYGHAEANNSRAKLYDDAYNARTNENKEIVSLGRAPTNSGPSLGHQEINVEKKKIEADRINNYTRLKGTTFGDVYNSRSVSSCTNTSNRNFLPQDEIRLDTGILDAFKMNPLTQSLQSYS